MNGRIKHQCTSRFCLAGYLCALLVTLRAASSNAQDLMWVKESNAPWQARDSQGELVFRDHLWILGGWFNSFASPPRDVWSSHDGVSWTCVQPNAPWLHSDLPMTVTFRDRMWLMGGWYNGRLPGHSASNQVWSSEDGLSWRQESSKSEWSPRLAGALVEFKGKLFMLGGIEDYYFGNRESIKNDVWSSEDGKNWNLVTANAGWSPRAYHQAVVLNDKIYVMGGGNYLPDYHATNDVWSTIDGKNWVRETDSADWHPRLWFSAVSYRNRMWVLGGWSNNPSKNWGDAWYSADGRNWNQLTTALDSWKERHEHSAFVMQDKLWIAGGHAQPLSNEVWSLQLPKNWPNKYLQSGN